MNRIKEMLVVARTGAPGSREAAEGILEVDTLPTMDSDADTVEKVKAEHASEIKKLEEAHEEALDNWWSRRTRICRHSRIRSSWRS
eukprot:475949-Pleurochrysis_carterae.AAC.1